MEHSLTVIKRRKFIQSLIVGSISEFCGLSDSCMELGTNSVDINRKERISIPYRNEK